MEVLPKYSKQQVNNAGYIITGKKEANREQQVGALKIIEDFRILHFKPTLGIRSFVTGRLSKIGLLDNKNIIVQRLKKMSTLIDKIGKRKDKSIDDLYDVQDIGGVRVVLNNCEEVYKLKTNLEKEPTIHKIRKVKDYIATPK